MSNDSNLVKSRMKMFQTASSIVAASNSKTPPTLPAKPTKQQMQQINAAGKFIKNNVKMSDVKTAMIIGGEICKNSDKFNNNDSPTTDAGKVLSTAKFLQANNIGGAFTRPVPAPVPNNSTHDTWSKPAQETWSKPTTSPLKPTTSPLKPLPKLPPTIVGKPQPPPMPTTNARNTQPPPMPTIVRNTQPPPMPKSKSHDFQATSSISVREITDKLQQETTRPTVVRPQSTSKNEHVKSLRADLESKLTFGPPTVVYPNSANRRHSSSNQENSFNFPSSVSYPSNFVDSNDHRISPTSPTNFDHLTKVLPTPSSKWTPPNVSSHEPYGILLFDFIGQQNDELTCKSGDRVNIQRYIDDDWVFACNLRTQRVGIVPRSYVEVKVDLKLSPHQTTSPPKSPITSKNNKDEWDEDSGVDSAHSAHEGPRCYTLHDFNSGETGDLAFCQGEIIRLTKRMNADWLEGESHDGRHGIFPASFVQVIEDIVDSSSSSPPKQPTALSTQRQENSAHQPQMAFALYDFSGTDSNDLTLNTGDEIEITNVIDEEWLYGTNVNTNKKGIFPKNFVEYFEPSNSFHEEQQTSHHSPHQTHDSLVGKVVVALYDYTSSEPKDLCFQAGDEIEITKVLDNYDWYEGRLMVGLTNKRCMPVGLVPRNYVNLMP